ncbi:MAG: PhoX family protein [Burkholderiales bacterium]
MQRTNRLDSLIAKAISRRQFLQATSALAASGLVAGCATSSNATTASHAFTFKSVAPSVADRVVVAEGYSAMPFFLHGDPVSDGPGWKFNASNSSDEAMQQGGQMHDGMWFFPLPVGSNKSDHGLLVMNHEYPRAAQLFPDADKDMSAEKVRKMHATVGVSVLEVKLENGSWKIVRPSNYARRIHGLTPARLGGPAAGAALMKSALDPTGFAAMGTMGNCGIGTTPWGTYLTCEENFHDYFSSMGGPVNPMQARYTLRPKPLYKHPEFDARHDASKHPNEFNKVGWVVEIDPFDPTWVPAKRTALGRCCHESAHYAVAKDGRLVVYTGDDARFEYVYKFVSRDRVNATNRAANRDLLDHGTLYVARFDAGADGNAQGRGRWIALEQGQNGLTADKGFPAQAEVVTFARAAADVVGATKCDRPEWIAIEHKSGEVYAAFTGNGQRGRPDKEGANAANPRVNNLYGHIVRWREDGGDAASTTFEWDVFLSCGNPQQNVPALRGNLKGDLFTNPDTLTIDYAGRLWACTDTAEAPEEELLKLRGNDSVIAIDRATGESRRFLVGPVGAELTGLTFTPDMRTAWVNVQHPMKDWPNTAVDGKPRTATVIIRKTDGGVIGS